MQVNLLAQATGAGAALDLSDSFKSQEQQRWLQGQLPFNTTLLVSQRKGDTVKSCLSLQVNLLAQATGAGAALDLSDSFKSQEQQRWLQGQLPFNTTQLVADLCATLDELRIPYRRGPPAGPALMTIDIALVEKKVSHLMKSLPLLYCCITAALVRHACHTHFT